MVERLQAQHGASARRGDEREGLRQLAMSVQIWRQVPAKEDAP
jgi:hypothetical protein